VLQFLEARVQQAGIGFILAIKRQIPAKRPEKKAAS